MNLKILRIIAVFLLLSACVAAEIGSIQDQVMAKKWMFDRNKGNCLACHRIQEGELAGNLGPELKDLTLKFKTKTQLYQFIWDATAFNPKTAMPPFGKHKILTEDEITLIVDYLWRL
jgi:sulfur-oxidizing protein SoxX